MTNFKNPDPKKINDPSKCLAIMNDINRHGTQELWGQFFQRYCELKASEYETN